MAIARGFAATAMFAGLALGLAAPATAAPVMSGHYIETQTDPSTGQPMTSGGQPITDDWYFTPCGDGCGSVAHTPDGPALGQAQLINGQWALNLNNLELRCSDGTSVPNVLSSQRRWDQNTLAGTAHDTINAPACGQPAGYSWSLNSQLRQAP
jgi:hypothetical protein